MQEEINEQHPTPPRRSGRARALVAAVVGAGALAVGIPAAVAIADTGSSPGTTDSGSYFAPSESGPSFIQEEGQQQERPGGREDCPEKDGRGGESGGSESQTPPGESL